MKILFLVVTLFLFSCSEEGLNMLDTGQADETVFRVENVKLIQSNISNPRDKTTSKQRRYLVNSESRLLFGYYKFSQNYSAIDQTMPIRIKIHVVSADKRPVAQSNFQICPLQSQWMPLATWGKAHPFKNGSWTQGGDIDTETCISATPEPCDGFLCFDMSNWFKSYFVESQGQMNFGWALISHTGEIVEIYGDFNLSKGPRVSWTPVSP